MLLISGVEHNSWFREVPSCELPKYLCTFWSCKFPKKNLDSRVIKRGKKSVTEYYIKWLGYDHSYDSWEPEANLHCPDLLRQFLREQSNKRATPLPTSNQPSTRSKRKRTRD